ncbi:MAG: GNAT family N-acetyltransferase [Firmicutes bacterium]|nr:GNAT family N-acetyltransferase [Bacillota bacterium]MDD4336825.1 GNAT family N-acetyltransferase [Bacillota bacterium]MDD4791445.1 GNAT family N-acetyltransferase [Bacillota bacterium]
MSEVTVAGDIEKNIRVASDYGTLSELQKLQFRRVIMEGLKSKFITTLQDDTDSILSIVDIWIKYGFLPMDQTFCAIDMNTEEVLAILLLNNFHKPNLLDSARCLISVIWTIGMKKALRVAFNFLALDNINKEDNRENIKAEIYLLSTGESQRGKGIGTILVTHALDKLHSEHERELSRNADCRVKLFVFAKNPAMNLWVKLGFKQVGSVATPKLAKVFGGSYDVYVRMERPL